jgi:hypothetical protein
MSLQLNVLPGVERLIEFHRAAGQQPDNLCGPYWVAILLRAFAEQKLTPSDVGQLARSLLPIGDPVDWVPAGASPRQDYSLTLPCTENLSIAGTSIMGLIESVKQATGDRWCLIPVQADWNAQRVSAFIHLCLEYDSWQAIPIANWNTAYLWGSSLPLIDVLAYLKGDRITPPPPDWEVGHFAVLAGQVTGTRSLVVVQDTYPRFGWDGYHLQSEDAIATALNRPTDAPRTGGILLFANAELRSVIERVLQTQSFRIAPWDNGTLWEP